MPWLRERARCIGLSGSFSVVGDFYGYRDQDGKVDIPRRLSLLTQMRRLGGCYIDINLIRVGIEAFTNDDEREINRAVDFLRECYAQVDLGVGRVERWEISQSSSHGLHRIHNKSDAKQLTDDFTVHNDFIDAFFVLFCDADFVGLSYPRATCIKETIGIMTGVVVELVDYFGMPDFSMTGYALAHEIGHHLGLDLHRSDPLNLMHKYLPNGGRLTDFQGGYMRTHCSVKTC